MQILPVDSQNENKLQALYFAKLGNFEYRRAGVSLLDSIAHVNVDPTILGKLCSCRSPEEFLENFIPIPKFNGCVGWRNNFLYVYYDN